MHIITVTIYGGVCQDVENVPADIQVHVKDYSTDNGDDNVHTDENGNHYSLKIY